RLGAVGLFDLLITRSEPDLLVAKLSKHGISVVAIHDVSSSRHINQRRGGNVIYWCCVRLRRPAVLNSFALHLPTQAATTLPPFASCEQPFLVSLEKSASWVPATAGG